MKTKNLKKLLNYDLQLFADGDDSGSNDGDNNGNNNDDVDHDTDDQNRGEKTFTQSEVSNMMAKEKNEGKRSVLKALGFKSENDAKEAIEKYNKYLEDQKSEADKQKEALDKANNEKDEAIKRAKNAEDKVACYAIGINPECVDDVLAIASTKVSDEKDLETVLKEMKEDKKYGSFFVKESSGSKHGTGSNAGHSGNEDKEENLGKRLAEARKASTNKTKSNYFND